MHPDSCATPARKQVFSARSQNPTPPGQKQSLARLAAAILLSAFLALGISGCSGSASSAKTTPKITFVTQNDAGQTQVETCRLEMAGIKSQVSRVDCETQR